MKYEIQSLGSFVPTDNDGYLINTNAVANIVPPFDRPLKAIIDSYQNIFLNKVHSIYIRGSVARGATIVGFSDYDCFAVLNVPATDKEIRLVDDAKKKLRTTFTYVSNFDLSYFTLLELKNDKTFDHWAFALKIQSVCVYGKSLMDELPKFKPDFSIAFYLRTLEKRMKKAEDRIFNDFYPSMARYWCAWIMRSYVRASMELVMEREMKYTNVLFLCQEVFAKYYPKQQNLMWTALNLSINPITDLDEIISLTRLVGTWLITERDNILLSHKEEKKIQAFA